jgi:hypothetical protein
MWQSHPTNTSNRSSLLEAPSEAEATNAFPQQAGCGQ